jgi:hypothetical protein
VVSPSQVKSTTVSRMSLRPEMSVMLSASVSSIAGITPPPQDTGASLTTKSGQTPGNDMPNSSLKATRSTPSAGIDVPAGKRARKSVPGFIVSGAHAPPLARSE